MGVLKSEKMPMFQFSILLGAYFLFSTHFECNIARVINQIFTVRYKEK